MSASGRMEGRISLAGMVALTVVASALVAISARGLRLLPPPADLDGPWVWGIRFGGAALAAAGLTLLLGERRRWRRAGSRGPDPVAGPLTRAATIMGLLTLAALLVRPPVRLPDPLRQGPTPTRVEPQPDNEPGTGGSPPTGMAGDRGGGGGSGGGGSGGGSGRQSSVVVNPQPDRSLLERLAGSLPLRFLFLMGVVALFILMLFRMRRRVAFPDYLAVAQEDADAGLEASLAEVVGEGGDPQEQVTAAYLRLLAALADAGAPRRAEEAPYEHLRRTLGPLGVHPEPLHRLTELYVMAQFSERPVTEDHRAAAVRALEVSLEGLRQVRHQPGATEFIGSSAEAWA